MRKEIETYILGTGEQESRIATIGELRDRLISRWVLKRLSREKESKTHSSEDISQFNENLSEEIRLFSYDFDKSDPESTVLKKIVKAKALELLRTSIEQGFDSEDTLLSIGTQLQEQVTTLENNDKQDINSFLNKYYDYREKILKTYRTFLYRKELIRSFILGNTNKQEDVNLGPFGIEIISRTQEGFKKLYEKITGKRIEPPLGASTSSTKKKIYEFRNSHGALNINIIDGSIGEDGVKVVLQHERSHSFYDLLLAERNKVREKEVRQKIAEIYQFVEDSKKGIIPEIESPILLEKYRSLIATLFTFYDYSYCTEAFAYALEDLKLQIPVDSVTYEPFSEDNLLWTRTSVPSNLSPEKNILSKINPYREGNLNSNRFYSPSADLNLVFNLDLYNYLSNEGPNQVIGKINELLAGDDEITQEVLDEILEDEKNKRKKTLSEIRSKINALCQYYPEQRGTMIYYLIDSFDIGNWSQMLDDFIEKIAHDNPSEAQRWLRLKNKYDTINLSFRSK